MEDWKNKKSYKRTIEILRLYTNSDLPEKVEHEVKRWLVSKNHLEEKDIYLWELWNKLEVFRTGNEKKSWKIIVKKAGLKQFGI